jgi:hypothetical protein
MIQKEIYGIKNQLRLRRIKKVKDSHDLQKSSLDAIQSQQLHTNDVTTHDF